MVPMKKTRTPQLYSRTSTPTPPTQVKRVEDSLNAEFPVDSQDEKGNTLLLLASQNCNRKLMELALNRGANINHQNTLGNTALHFAMAYDTEVRKTTPR